MTPSTPSTPTTSSTPVTPGTPGTPAPIVRCDMAVSVDGFVAGLDARQPPFVDDDFHRVTRWVFDESDATKLMHAERIDGTGAYVMGRRMYDSGGDYWNVESPYKKDVFVVTHRPKEPVELKDGTVFHFVTEGGVPAAIEAAKAVCPPGKRVHLSGGASAVQQALAADLIDELHLHVAGVLLGQGIRLFDDQPRQTELEPFRVIAAEGVTHVSYRVLRSEKG